MKFLLFIIIGFMTALGSSAQHQDTVTDIKEIGSEDNLKGFDCILSIEKHPEFPGGQDSLFCFLEKYWKGTAIEDYKSEGVILVRFTIDSLGHVQDLEINPNEIVKIASHLDFVTDKTIKDLVFATFDNMPDWDTSSGNDQSQFTMMLRFPYDKRCEKK